IDRSGTLTLLSQPPGGSLGGRDYSLRRIGPAFPGFEAAELQVVSRDGGEMYVFDAKGLHLRTVDTLTGATLWRFVYDDRNLVTEVRDVNGLATRIERSSGGAPTAIVGPYGHRTTLALDATGFLSAVTDPAGSSTTLGHGTAGLLGSIRGPRGNVFGVSYDEKGRATRMAHPNGGTWTVTHAYLDGTGESMTSLDPTGDRTLREVRLLPDGSSAARVAHPDASVSSELRTATGTLIVTNANGTVITLQHSADPRFRGQTAVPSSVRLEIPGGPRATFATTRTAGLLDPNNPFSFTNLAATVSINGRLFRDHYDPLTGRLTSTTPEGRTVSTEYDAAGRLLLEQVGTDSPVTHAYDVQGRLIATSEGDGPGTRVRRYEYNAAGQVERVTDPLGRTMEFAYDALARPRSVTLPDRGVVALEYDAESNVTGVTPPGRPKHEFGYDSVGSLVRYTPPSVGTDDSWVYGYDLDRDLTRIDFPDGQAWTLVRGVDGRPERLELGAGTRLEYRYQPNTGQLTGIQSSTGEGIAFAYLGSLPVQTRWSGVVTGSVHLEFDENLQLAAHTVNAERTAYAYDRDGLLVQAGALAITRYGASGRVMTNRVGAVVQTFAYDARGMLTNSLVRVGGSEFSRVSLRYDASNRVTERSETMGGSTQDLRYTYDPAGRLSEVRRGDVVVATYTYDSNGNRLARNGETAVYDAQDRVTEHGGVSLGWSRNGHRVSRAVGGRTTTYAYDLRGVLTSVKLPSQQIDYPTDPLGRRLGREVNGSLDRGWLWLDQQIVAEVGQDSAVTKRFVYSGDSTTPVVMVAGSDTFFLLSDERGSVRRVLNAADGSVAQALEYDEFGRVLSDTNPGFQPFGFAGGLYDPATGLVRLGARDYDAETGQWTARDPIGFAGGQFSLYAYVRNDPVNFVDPSGTGPFLGFLDRNRQRAIDAAFDTSPGNNQRFEKALDRYDQSVKAAVLTGQVLVTTGQLLNSIAPGPRGPRAGFGRVGVGGKVARTGASAAARAGGAAPARFSPTTLQWARTGASSTRS
ncbi:MAG: hypothetical protein JNL97_00200, partial [Verrucomicrobiales bacterium]|nr:hypothetical protein [Verrucomicrobiales bacterium]